MPAPTDAAAAQAECERCSAIAWERRAEYVFHPQPLDESVARARALGASRHDGPILLIDHCDNCGSGGAQDVMRVVEEILRQELDDVAIAPIRDPQAVAQMVEAGMGNNVNLELGGKTDMPAIGLAGKPLQLAGRVRNITDGEIVFTGPMYTGLKSHLGRTAVLDTGRAQIVVTERHHEPFDLVIFRHCGIEPTKKKFIMLKSRIHYRAGFKPIAAHIVECAGAGVTNADLSVYRYRKLARPIYPLDLLEPISKETGSLDRRLRADGFIIGAQATNGFSVRAGLNACALRLRPRFCTDTHHPYKQLFKMMECLAVDAPKVNFEIRFWTIRLN